jgi:hypothetical protein
MSQAPPPIDRDAEMLARLAEMDMAAAEHVHAKLMAASDTAEIAELGRSYHRVSRCLRQTLALKAKLAREQVVAASYAAIRGAMRSPAIEGFAVDDKAMDLQDAVERVTEAAFLGDEDRITTVLGRFDSELDDWVEEADFADADLDEQVRRACRLLELPEELAAVWRTLPRPTFSPDPVTNDSPVGADGEDPPQPWSSSG